jgi:uncharacterized protein
MAAYLKTTASMLTAYVFAATLMMLPTISQAKRIAPTIVEQDTMRNPKLAIRALSIKKQTLHVEVARSEQERMLGLMNRTTLAPNQGMLFVFEPREKGVQCFWMKNTLLPLTAAFIDDDGTIVNLVDMQPQTETPHCSQKPVRYVLEMKQGWFATHTFKAGDKVKDLPK